MLNDIATLHKEWNPQPVRSAMPLADVSPGNGTLLSIRPPMARNMGRLSRTIFLLRLSTVKLEWAWYGPLTDSLVRNSSHI